MSGRLSGAGARLRLGMLTPSSNTVLEPLTAAMLAGAPDVTAHFARIRVLSIGLDAAATAQFDPAPVLAAAELLADAKVQAICWNGTSGAWLGRAADEALAAAITAHTGIPATTATLALLDSLGRFEARRIALVTPYLAEVQQAIVQRFATEGVDCVAEQHLGDPGNFSFAEHAEDKVEELVREVATAAPQAIVIHCTNFRGGRIAPRLEAELDVPVLDSVAVALWGALRCAGAASGVVRGWGRLFDG